MGFEDINDTRNGLRLWKSLEWAVDSWRLFSTYNRVNLITLGHVHDYFKRKMIMSQHICGRQCGAVVKAHGLCQFMLSASSQRQG